MPKDFTEWHKVKTWIENDHPAPLFRSREVWWCSLGSNVGTEEDGKNNLYERPVVVIQKFNRDMFWGLPMTSRKKEGKFYYSFLLHDLDRTAILSQLRVLSAKCLIRRIGKISQKEFAGLQQVVTALIIDK